MSYYGVVLNTANLGGDLYLNFVLLTVVEYPGKLLTMLLLDRVGRKVLYIGFLVVGGIACIATIWPIAVESDGICYCFSFHNNLNVKLQVSLLLHFLPL